MKNILNTFYEKVGKIILSSKIYFFLVILTICMPISIAIYHIYKKNSSYQLSKNNLQSLNQYMLKTKDKRRALKKYKEKSLKSNEENFENYLSNLAFQKDKVIKLKNLLSSTCFKTNNAIRSELNFHENQNKLILDKKFLSKEDFIDFVYEKKYFKLQKYVKLSSIDLEKLIYFLEDILIKDNSINVNKKDNYFQLSNATISKISFDVNPENNEINLNHLNFIKKNFLNKEKKK